VTRRQFLALIVPLLVVLIGFVVLVALERSGRPGAPAWDSAFFRHVRERMADDFVWGMGDDRRGWEAYFRALNAWVQTYDRFAEVVPPWLVEQAREDSSGQYMGIGIRIEPPDGLPVERIRIIGVKPGGPAAKAGIVVDDEIVGVGDRRVSDLWPKEPEPPESEPAAVDLRPLQRVIRGPEGTTVELRIRDPEAGTERAVDVERAQIDTGSVFAARIVDKAPPVGYVRVGSFQASTARDLREEIEKLLEEGMRALVLDLRSNRGGLLDQAVEVADLFLDQGIIVRQRGRLREFSDQREARADGTLSTTLPLAVLINEESASASEILAAALRDHRRAVLVGEHTYGKFLVQIVEEVPMDIGVALFKRTTSIYETPLGHHYQRAPQRNGEDPLAGIAPDLFVPLEKAERKQLRGRFEHEYYADWNPDRPAGEPFEDRQLAAARALLRGETYYPRLPPRPDPLQVATGRSEKPRPRGEGER
jgi:carboxyl-terminal processing protease